MRESQLRKIVEIKLIASHNYGKQSKKKIYKFIYFLVLFIYLLKVSFHKDLKIIVTPFFAHGAHTNSQQQ